MARDRSPAPPTLRQLLGRVHLKLILFTVVLAGLTMMVSGFVLLRSYATRNLELVAQSIEYTVEPAIVFGDTGAVRNGIASVVGQDSVASVEVDDPGGKQLARWENDPEGVFARIDRIAQPLLSPAPIVRTVKHDGTVIANIRIHGSAGAMTKYLLAGFVVSLLCLAFAAVTSSVLARRLQQIVLGPLDRIGAVAHAVRSERAFQNRVPTAGLAEIDKLANDFNSLLAELEIWHFGLTRENEALAHQVNHDALTGLGNRLAFDQRLDWAIQQSLAQSNGFAVLYLDLNRFKEINDAFGHDAGDSVLRTVAGRLALVIRHQDSAFRLGGDEFAVILSPCENRDDMTQIVHRIAEAFETPTALPDGTEVQMSLSIGFALYPDDGTEPEDLVRHADREMYREKFGRSRNEGNPSTH